MIKKFNDYDKTKGYGNSEQLPRGGYVCTILGAKAQENEYGQSIKIAFDIAEGEYAGYYQRKFDSNTNEDKKWPGVFMLNVPSDDGSERDGWTKRRFRTFTDALEDSNSNYHFDWDETKFKGKLIGFVFNFREWESSDGRVLASPNAANVTSVQNIQKGNFKIPEDKLLKGNKHAVSNAQQAQASTGGFVNIPEGTDTEVPF